MKNLFKIGLLLYCPIIGFSQQLEKSVVSGSSNLTLASQNTQLTQTLGEPLVINRQGTNTSISEGFLQGYKIKVTPLARKQELANNPAIQVYPNPTSSYVTVTGIQNYSVVVLDAAGKQIIQHQNTQTVDFSNYATGIYTLQIIQQNKQIAAYQIVKE